MNNSKGGPFILVLLHYVYLLFFHISNTESFFILNNYPTAVVKRTTCTSSCHTHRRATSIPFVKSRWNSNNNHNSAFVQFMNDNSNNNNNNNNNNDNSNDKEVGNDYNENNTIEGRTPRKKSVARAGGRNPKLPQQLQQKEVPSKSDTTLFYKYIQKVIPLVVLLLLLKNIFGFLFFGFGRSSISSNDFVYYQSTVYESRTYNENGQLERIRKESVKSNIPSIMNGNIDKGQAELDEELDRELDDIYRTRFGANGIIIPSFY